MFQPRQEEGERQKITNSVIIPRDVRGETYKILGDRTPLNDVSHDIHKILRDDINPAAREIQVTRSLLR